MIKSDVLGGLDTCAGQPRHIIVELFLETDYLVCFHSCCLPVQTSDAFLSLPLLGNGVGVSFI